MLPVNVSQSSARGQSQTQSQRNLVTLTVTPPVLSQSSGTTGKLNSWYREKIMEESTFDNNIIKMKLLLHYIHVRQSRAKNNIEFRFFFILCV